MKITRNYLTAEEIGMILVAMEEKSTSLEQEMVKFGLATQCVCQFEDKEIETNKLDSCNAIYDYVLAQGLYNDIISIVNYDTIDRIYKDNHGIIPIVSEFCQNVEKTITKYGENLSDISLKNIIEQLKEVSE